MFLIAPYHADVPFYRRPVANYVLVAVTCAAFFVQFSLPKPVVESLMLQYWDLAGMVGYMFLHAGPMHLIGNMVFLVVFGNAVCAKVGNLAYVPLYFGLGLVAAAAHNLFSGGPAIGASGAINGIVGLFLVWYPNNQVRCFYLIFLLYFFRVGSFAVRSLWIIMLWVCFDVMGLLLSGGSVAYHAHLGGFAAGVGVASALLAAGLIRMDRGERSLWARFGLGVGGRARGSEEELTPPTEEARGPAAPGSPAQGAVPVMCACGRRGRVPAAWAGRRIRCPKCGRTMRVPDEGPRV